MNFKKHYTYDKRKDKGLMFFSAGSPSDCSKILDNGINDILVSYFYLRKRKRIFEEEIIPRIIDNGGLFMTDSGGFSFISGGEKPEFYTEEYWLPYVNEYLEWLDKFADKIFVAANLDLDIFVGRDKINQWNADYFKPLEKKTNIVYVAQRDWNRQYADWNGMKRFKEYCSLHDYVGVNKNYADMAAQVFAQAKITKTKIHGFAWTSIPRLKSHPLFSVDSTTWIGGAKYGSSYVYDGKNFSTLDHKHKYKRVGDKIFCRDNGIDYEALLRDEAEAVHDYNLVGWLGGRREYLRAANAKLWNLAPDFYKK